MAADGVTTRFKDLDAMTRDNKTKLDDLSLQFNQLNETVKDNKKLMEDRFDEILGLLGKGKQKTQEIEIEMGNSSQAVHGSSTLPTPSLPHYFYHQQF
ncbi:hypothetical protein FRX31_002854, partial [Thalictrum thalictroides]